MTVPAAGGVAAPTVTVAGPTVTVTVSATPAPPAAGTTFEDGDYVVGTDIQAGTYRTAEAVTSGDMCYWGIYKAGTNKGDIIQNDIVTGGRPSVTLKAGQEFSSTRCGTWVKQ